MNICDCPEPPGGRVECSDDQLAICGYQNGKIVNGCYSRPAYVSLLAGVHEYFDSLGIHRLDNLVTCNWLISTATASPRGDADPIEETQLAMLRSGRYQDERTGEVLNFKLPRTIQLESWRLEKSLTVESTPGPGLKWPPDSLEEDALRGWMHSVTELSHRLQHGVDLKKLNRALAELKRWYELVLANPDEARQMIAESQRELARLIDEEANRKSARRSSWMRATKRQNKDAPWMEILLAVSS